MTTLSCLVAASWPEHRRVVLAECDPSGGDLAARFCLSARLGWSTFTTASRRSGPASPLAPHLQQLPGGLDVLVGHARADGEPLMPVDELLATIEQSPDGNWDVLADLGRLLPGRTGGNPWLQHSDVVVVLLRGEPSSIIHVRDRAAGIQAMCGCRTVLVLLEGGPRAPSEIESFTGLPVLATVPYDPPAASAVGGARGRTRRLQRSHLAASARGLATVLSDPEASLFRDGPTAGTSNSCDQLVPDGVGTSEPAGRIRALLTARRPSNRRHGSPESSPAPDAVRTDAPLATLGITGALSAPGGPRCSPFLPDAGLR